MALPKKEQFSEWYSELMKEAELVDLRYGVKGFIVIRPWAMYILKKMYSYYEEILEQYNHMPVHFPVVIPERYLTKEKEHIKGFEGEVFWITRAGFNELEERLALRPTSETAMYPMYALWTSGRKDLPIKLYMSELVWRYETKATRPLIRGREFWWIEAHCAFATKEEAEAQVREDMLTAKKAIWETFGVPFLFFKRPEWDKFAGADYTFAADTLMPDGRVLQIATTHLLGQNFSRPFEFKFMDTDGKEKYAWQTSYGPGMNRILAAMISWFGDDKGLILPFHLAPVQVVIVPIFKDESKKKVLGYAKEVEGKLKALGYRVELDDAEDETPGFKFNKWELKGVPIRVEVGPKEAEAKALTVVRRDNREKQQLSLEEAAKIEEIAKLMFEEMRKKNEEKMRSSIVDAKNWDELKKGIEEGKIVRVAFCSVDKDGEACYAKIKEELKAEVRGELLEKEEKPESGAKCVVCGKEAKHIVYVARQY